MKYLPLIWSDIWRKPRRTTLMLLQVAVAFALFGVPQGMKTGVDQSKGLEDSGEAALRIDQLAKMAGMGVSTLNRHFHELTDMSPIQYQKRLQNGFTRFSRFCSNQIASATDEYAVAWTSAF